MASINLKSFIEKFMKSDVFQKKHLWKTYNRC